MQSFSGIFLHRLNPNSNWSSRSAERRKPSLLPPHTHLPHPPLLLLSPLLVLQIPRLQPLQLLRNFFAFVRNPVRLTRLWPKLWDCEFAV
jgi:hypothetical protein